jgi:chromosome segregation ATPase
MTAMATDFEAENKALKAELALIRRIVVLPLDQTEAEVKALEPGSTASACRVIDIANLKSSNEAGARQNRELRTQVAELQASNASLREQGRVVEVELTATQALNTGAASMIDRLAAERDEARAEIERLKAKVNRMVRSAAIEDIQGVGR